MTCVAVELGSPRAFAACVKLRRSITRVNSLIASNRSMAYCSYFQNNDVALWQIIYGSAKRKFVRVSRRERGVQTRRRQMSKANGKVAVVTGSSRGIGAAIVERLAADGFTVVINYAGGAVEAEALVRKI